MVTVKRKVTNETERYGGYAEIEVKNPQATIDVRPQETSVGNSFRQAQNNVAETNFNYSQHAQVEKHEQPAMVQTPTPEEFMPTIRSESKESEAAVEAKQSIDSRTKLILGVYASIVLILSALVIATGIYLSSTNARINDLDNELAVKNATITRQLSELNMLSDEDALTGRAFNRGMEKIEDAEVVDLLPMHEAPTYEGTTNWFDSFCDWLSGVFGG